MLLGLRSPAGLGAIVLCSAVALVVGGAEGMTPSLVGYRVARLGAIMLGFLCLPMLAGAARRDASTRASDAVQSRPHQAHELLLARWIGNYAFILTLFVFTALFAFLAQAIFAGPMAEGAGPRVSVRAFADSVFAGAVPLLFLCALGFCAAELLQNVLAAAIVALYWILVLLGRDYLSRIFDFSLSQNGLVYILLSAGIVFAAMAVARWRQGLAGARKLNVPVWSGVFLIAGLGLAANCVLTRHDPPLHAHPVTLNVAGQSIRTGRLPGFWLPDQFGHRTRLHDHAGSILVVGFWSPAAPDSVANLATLARAHRKYRDRGVSVIGVCIADDWRIARRFGRERGYTFPMVTDRGTHWAEMIEDSSPLAEAYEVSGLPVTFIADERRNLVERIGTDSRLQWQAIDTKLTEMLAAR